MRALDLYPIWRKHIDTVKHCQDDDQVDRWMEVHNDLSSLILNADTPEPADLAAVVAVCAEGGFATQAWQEALSTRLTGLLATAGGMAGFETA